MHTNGGLGLNPLQPSEIEAWCRLTGNHLSPWEAETLLAMDRAFMIHVNKPKKDEKAKDGNAAAVMAALSGRKPKRK